MLKRTVKRGQLNIFGTDLENLIDSKHKLVALSAVIPWEKLEDSFSSYYSKYGRSSKPIRLMVCLLILKQMYNLSDVSVVERWADSPHFQYFSGSETYSHLLPCASSDLTHFRKRIGEKGITQIFKISVGIHGKKAQENEVLIDTTVQEKNITYPTDTKLYKKIVDQLVKIFRDEKLVLRQSYKRVSKKLMIAQRFRNHPKNRKKAISAAKKLKTIVGRLLREFYRNASVEILQKYKKRIEIFERVYTQVKDSKNKIYSIHEPEAYCISKGKEHKKYEFGSKASIVRTKNGGIIVGATSFKKNIHDNHTLPKVLEQVEDITGRRPEIALCDRGYRGKKYFDGTERLIPGVPRKGATDYEKRKARERFRKRAGIEPVIGHLKSDHRLIKNFLKGTVGDSINVMLAASAFNFKKWMRNAPLIFCLKRISQFLQNLMYLTTIFHNSVDSRKRFYITFA